MYSSMVNRNLKQTLKSSGNRSNRSHAAGRASLQAFALQPPPANLDGALVHVGLVLNSRRHANPVGPHHGKQDRKTVRQIAAT
jgi:hypothetical protein